MYVTSKTKEKFPLSPKKILKKTLQNTSGWIVLSIFFQIGGVATLASLSAQGYGSGMLMLIFLAGANALLVIIIFGTYLYQKEYFNRYYYEFDEHFIIIKKGVITPREISIPYERVQDVYVDQDLFDRILSIYDVHLSSATISSGMEAHIDGVDEASANGLKEALLEKVHTKITKK